MGVDLFFVLSGYVTASYVCVRDAQNGRAEPRLMAVSRSPSGRVSPRVVVVFHLAVAQGHRVYRAAVAPADCAIGFAVASGRDGSFFERWLVAVPMRRNFVHEHPQPPISDELWHSCSAYPFRSDLTFAFAISFSLKRPIALGLKR